MSTIEVNKIIPQGSGTALQIAEASDTITIPSGATLDASAATVQLPAGVGARPYVRAAGARAAAGGCGE